MPNTDRFSLLERWANGAEAFRDAMETKYGPAPTPPQLPPYTTYDAMLEAIVDNTVGAKRLLNKKSPTYHSDSAGYTKVVPAGDVHYASLEQIGGKTLVWNQLVNASVNPYDKSVSHSVADDVYTVASLYDASSQKYLRFVEASNLIQNHVYLGVADILVDNSNYYVYVQFVTGSGSSALSDETSLRATDTANYVRSYTLGKLTNETTGFAVRLANDMPQDVGGKVKNVQLYDLTLIFGAGNEPTTVDEFTAQFPASYYPYNAGTLLSAGVTEVKSVGINQWDEQWKVVGGNRIASENPIAVLPNTQYTFVASSQPSNGIKFYTLDMVQTGSTRYNTGTFTTPADCYWLTFEMGVSTYGAEYKHDISLNRGTDATYHPYNGHTYPIPAEIRNLEGYGWSAGSVYNYIDYESKKFIQTVGEVVLDGTQATGYIQIDSVACRVSYKVTGVEPFTTSNVVDDKIISSYLLPTKNDGGTSSGVAGIHRRSNGSSEILVSLGVGAVADLTGFNNYLSAHPLTVHYPLATPVETDISAYIIDDNLIEVEAGGSLTFPNSNGDDYRIPVPSSETFVVGEP